MTVETRTVQRQSDPALTAYLAWLESERPPFQLSEYDLFAAGYRAAHSERRVPAEPQTIRLAEAITALFALLDAEGVYIESEAHGDRLDAAQDRVTAILDEIAAEPGARGGVAP